VPRELYYKPASLFVADFMGNSSSMQGKVEQTGGGITTIRLQCGTAVKAAAAADHNVGQDVTVVVRQEELQIDNGSASDFNRVPVTVRQTVFLGGLVSVGAATGGGNLLTIKSQKPIEPMPDIGAASHVVWNPALTMVFQTPAAK